MANNCCPLCCEDWMSAGNKKDLKKCACPYCKFAVCEGCIKQYVLSSVNDPKCMNPDCGRGWTVDHIFNLLPSSFINGTYKKKREEVLYDRETAMMQGTQPYVEEQLRKERLAVEIVEKKLALRELAWEIGEMENDLRGFGLAPRERNAKNTYVGRCSSNECKGFVCAAEYKCGICLVMYCKKCMGCLVVTAEGDADNDENEHECKPEDVATFELLKKDTKPCPACATAIFRVSGCSQMFCTQCNVVWDWNTLKIEQNENAMHNPHYYAWRADAGAAAAAAAAAEAARAGPAVGPCGAGGGGGGDIRISAIEALWKGNILLGTAIKQYVINVHRVLHHINYVEIRMYRDDAGNIPVFDKNLDLRIRYLRNNVDNKRFKSLVQMREKASNKKREISQILTAFHLSGQDVLGELIAQKKKPNYVDFQKKFDRLCTYTKDALAGVAKRYTCKVPNIDEIVGRVA